MTLDAGDQSVEARLARLDLLEKSTSALRHDLRGMLSPALLVADRLVMHADPKVVRAGETIIKAVKRASDRLQETKELPP